MGRKKSALRFTHIKGGKEAPKIGNKAKALNASRKVNPSAGGVGDDILKSHVLALRAQQAKRNASRVEVDKMRHSTRKSSIVTKREVLAGESIEIVNEVTATSRKVDGPAVIQIGMDETELLFVSEDSDEEVIKMDDSGRVINPLKVSTSFEFNFPLLPFMGVSVPLKFNRPKTVDLIGLARPIKMFREGTLLAPAKAITEKFGAGSPSFFRIERYAESVQIHEHEEKTFTITKLNELFKAHAPYLRIKEFQKLLVHLFVEYCDSCPPHMFTPSDLKAVGKWNELMNVADAFAPCRTICEFYGRNAHHTAAKRTKAPTRGMLSETAKLHVHMSCEPVQELCRTLWPTVADGAFDFEKMIDAAITPGVNQVMGLFTNSKMKQIQLIYRGLVTSRTNQLRDLIRNRIDDNRAATHFETKHRSSSSSSSSSQRKPSNRELFKVVSLEGDAFFSHKLAKEYEFKDFFWNYQTPIQQVLKSISTKMETDSSDSEGNDDDEGIAVGKGGDGVSDSTPPPPPPPPPPTLPLGLRRSTKRKRQQN